MSPSPPDWPVPVGGAVVVVGLGAMGGSVAKAAMARFPQVSVQGVDPSPENAGLAARDGVEVVGGLGECRLASAVVVYAAPLDAVASLVAAEARQWSRAALATDVASLKAPVLAAARHAGSGTFVGAHPMCGSESAGYAAARADLFEGATVWLCPSAEEAAADAGRDAESEAAASDAGVSTTDAVARAKAFWGALGGRPRVVDPAWHDRTMSRASHLPQLVAWALAGVLAAEGVSRADLGPGGRGMTRLAASSPEMWLPLLEAAAADDAEALKRLERALAGVREALADGDEAALRTAIRKAGLWAAERS